MRILPAEFAVWKTGCHRKRETRQRYQDLYFLSLIPEEAFFIQLKRNLSQQKRIYIHRNETVCSKIYRHTATRYRYKYRFDRIYIQIDAVCKGYKIVIFIILRSVLRKNLRLCQQNATFRISLIVNRNNYHADLCNTHKSSLEFGLTHCEYLSIITL